MEQKTRKQAIERYIKGESPKSIYTDLKQCGDIAAGHFAVFQYVYM